MNGKGLYTGPCLATCQRHTSRCNPETDNPKSFSRTASQQWSLPYPWVAKGGAPWCSAGWSSGWSSFETSVCCCTSFEIRCCAAYIYTSARQYDMQHPGRRRGNFRNRGTSVLFWLLRRALFFFCILLPRTTRRIRHRLHTWTLLCSPFSKPTVAWQPAFYIMNTIKRPRQQ